MVRELIAAGYRTIGDIEVVKNAAYYAFQQLEQEYPPTSGSKFYSTGVVRLLFSLVDEQFANLIDIKAIYPFPDKYKELVKDTTELNRLRRRLKSYPYRRNDL